VVGAITLPAAASAQGSVTLGQTSPPGAVQGDCALPRTIFQNSVASGPDYRVPPGGGIITSWQHRNNVPPAGTAALLIGAPDASGSTLTVLVRTADISAPAGNLTTTPARIPVSGGERIGLVVPTGAQDSCLTAIAGSPFDEILIAGADLMAGQATTFIPLQDGRVNVAATLEPDQDKDQFGDETQDVAITSGPKRKTTSRKATLGLVGAASLECRLDKAPFAPCASPVKLKKLKPRKHTFQVHALTPGGEASPDQSYVWRVKKP
jgi:hypothetical protein